MGQFLTTPGGPRLRNGLGTRTTRNSILRSFSGSVGLIKIFSGLFGEQRQPFWSYGEHTKHLVIWEFFVLSVFLPLLTSISVICSPNDEIFPPMTRVAIRAPQIQQYGTMWDHLATAAAPPVVSAEEATGNIDGQTEYLCL